MPSSADEACIPITGADIEPFQVYRWSEVEQLAIRGFGLLVASPDGQTFYAETEVEYGTPSVL
jgi:hypothetical protein